MTKNAYNFLLQYTWWQEPFLERKSSMWSLYSRNSLWKQSLSNLMVNNSTNINKMNTYLSPQAIENTKYYDIPRWEARSWLGIGTNCGGI